MAILFDNPETDSSRDSNTDSSMQAAAQNRGTVGTAKPISGFFAATQADVDNAKTALKQRKEQSKFFQQFLGINLKHQEIDIADTKALSIWRVATLRNLMKKALTVGRGVARQTILQAQYSQKVAELAEATNQQINDLQARKRSAKERIKR